MHTDAERKYAAKAARVWCASREKVVPLLDCTRASRGSMPAKADGRLSHRDKFENKMEVGSG